MVVVGRENLQEGLRAKVSCDATLAPLPDEVETHRAPNDICLIRESISGLIFYVA